MKYHAQRPPSHPTRPEIPTKEPGEEIGPPRYPEVTPQKAAPEIAPDSPPIEITPEERPEIMPQELPGEEAD